MIVSRRVPQGDEDEEIDILGLSDEETTPEHQETSLSPVPIESLSSSLVTTPKDSGEESSGEEETEKNFLHILKEREYYEKLERKFYEKQMERKQQEAYIKEFLSKKKKSVEEIRKERDLERLITTNIFKTPSHLVDGDLEGNSGLCPPQPVVRTRVLETPSFRTFEEEDDGYDPIITQNFWNSYQTGYIKCDWIEPELRKLSSSKRRLFANFTPPSKKPKTAKMSKASKGNFSVGNEELDPLKHFHPNEWSIQEIEFLKQLLFIHGPQWELLQDILCNGKTASDIRQYFESQLHSPYLFQKKNEWEEEIKTKKMNSSSMEFKLSHVICAGSQEMKKEANPDENSEEKDIVMNEDGTLEFCPEANPMFEVFNSRSYSSSLWKVGPSCNDSEVEYGTKYSIGSTVYVFYQDRLKLPEGKWLEAVISEIRIKLKDGKEVQEYKVCIRNMHQSNSFWVVEDNLRKNLDIGMEVWEYCGQECSKVDSTISTSQSGRGSRSKRTLHGKEELISSLLECLSIFDKNDLWTSTIDESSSLFPSPSGPFGILFSKSLEEYATSLEGLREKDLLHINYKSIFSSPLPRDTCLHLHKVLQSNFDSILRAVDQAVNIIYSRPSTSNPDSPPKSEFEKNCFPTSAIDAVLCKCLLSKRELLLEIRRCLRIKTREIQHEHRTNVCVLQDSKEVLEYMELFIDQIVTYKKNLFSLATERFELMKSQLGNS